MAPFGCWGLPVALLTLLCCPGSGEKAFEVSMWPEQVTVKHGESLTVNCSTSCLQPQAGGLETVLSKRLLAEAAQWKQFLVYNVSKDTALLCYFSCFGEQKSKTANVSVFYPPEQVLLHLQPTQVICGGSITMECRVPAVAPLEKLTLTLLHGNKPLHQKTFEGATADPKEAIITYNITIQRKGGDYNLSCRAELDLGSPDKSIIRKVSESQIRSCDSTQMIIIITVSVLLFLFVTSVLLCFVFGQRWHQRRQGTYGVQAAWRRLRQAYQVQAA